LIDRLVLHSKNIEYIYSVGAGDMMFSLLLVAVKVLNVRPM
jgi:hypothetical protein